MTRDQRQVAVYRWVVETFGEPNANVTERVLRFFEEAVELAQAEAIAIDQLHAIISHVYRKPPGKPRQEVGGIGTTLLAYCEAKGISAEAAEEAEWQRIQSIKPEFFRQRHNLKADAGIAKTAPPLRGEKPSE